jgi:hypothetical protein
VQLLSREYNNKRERPKQAREAQSREAKSAIARNNSVVNGCAGRTTSIVDEACSEASDAEGYFFNWPFAPDRRWMLGYRRCLSASGAHATTGVDAVVDG